MRFNLSIERISSVLAFLLLIMMFTNSILFVAHYAGIDSPRHLLYIKFSALIFLSIGYFSVIRRVVLNKLGFFWIVGLSLFPFLITFVHFLTGIVDVQQFISTVGRSLFFGLLVIVSAAFVFVNNLKNVSMFFIIALLLLVLGMSLNVSFPDKFVTIQNLYSAKDNISSYGFSRMSGFFDNPNYNALAIVFSYIYLHYLLPTGKLKILLLFLAIASLILTGSRTSIVSMVFCLTYFQLKLLKPSASISKKTANSVVSIIFITLFIGPALIYGFQFLLNTDLAVSNVLDRASTIPQMILDSSAREDNYSTRVRIQQLPIYLDAIMENPVIGHGEGITNSLIELGLVINVSQNTFIDWTINFGLIGLALILMAFVYSYSRSYKKNWNPEVKRFNTLLVTVLLALALYGLSITMMFWREQFAIVIGFLLGLYLKLATQNFYQQGKSCD